MFHNINYYWILFCFSETQWLVLYFSGQLGQCCLSFPFLYWLSLLWYYISSIEYGNLHTYLARKWNHIGQGKKYLYILLYITKLLGDIFTIKWVARKILYSSSVLCFIFQTSQWYFGPFKNFYFCSVQYMPTECKKKVDTVIWPFPIQLHFWACQPDG